MFHEGVRQMVEQKRGCLQGSVRGPDAGAMISGSYNSRLSSALLPRWIDSQGHLKVADDQGCSQG